MLILSTYEPNPYMESLQNTIFIHKNINARHFYSYEVFSLRIKNRGNQTLAAQMWANNTLN